MSNTPRWLIVFMGGVLSGVLCGSLISISASLYRLAEYFAP